MRITSRRRRFCSPLMLRGTSTYGYTWYFNAILKLWWSKLSEITSHFVPYLWQIGMTNVCLWCMLFFHVFKLFVFTKRHTNLHWHMIVTDYLEFINLKISLFMIHFTDCLVELLAVPPSSSYFKTISSSLQTWFRQFGRKVRYRILLFLKMACSTGIILSCHKVGSEYQLHASTALQ